MSFGITIWGYKQATQAPLQPPPPHSCLLAPPALRLKGAFPTPSRCVWAAPASGYREHRTVCAWNVAALLTIPAAPPPPPPAPAPVSCAHNPVGLTGQPVLPGPWHPHLLLIFLLLGLAGFWWEEWMLSLEPTVSLGRNLLLLSLIFPLPPLPFALLSPPPACLVLLHRPHQTTLDSYPGYSCGECCKAEVHGLLQARERGPFVLLYRELEYQSKGIMLITTSPPCPHPQDVCMLSSDSFIQNIKILMEVSSFVPVCPQTSQLCQTSWTSLSSIWLRQNQLHTKTQQIVFCHKTLSHSVMGPL